MDTNITVGTSSYSSIEFAEYSKLIKCSVQSKKLYVYATISWTSSGKSIQTERFYFNCWDQIPRESIDFSCQKIVALGDSVTCRYTNWALTPLEEKESNYKFLIATTQNDKAYMLDRSDAVLNTHTFKFCEFKNTTTNHGLTYLSDVRFDMVTLEISTPIEQVNLNSGLMILDEDQFIDKQINCDYYHDFDFANITEYVALRNDQKNLFAVVEAELNKNEEHLGYMLVSDDPGLVSDVHEFSVHDFTINVLLHKENKATTERELYGGKMYKNVLKILKFHIKQDSELKKKIRNCKLIDLESEDKQCVGLDKELTEDFKKDIENSIDVSKKAGSFDDGNNSINVKLVIIICSASVFVISASIVLFYFCSYRRRSKGYTIPGKYIFDSILQYFQKKVVAVHGIRDTR